MAWVTMTVSVGNDHLAGKRYNLPAEQADRWIVKGYADGKTSRTYSPGEREQILRDVQTVYLGKGS